MIFELQLLQTFTTIEKSVMKMVPMMSKLMRGYVAQDQKEFTKAMYLKGCSMNQWMICCM
jgi:hypothetical protein